MPAVLTATSTVTCPHVTGVAAQVSAPKLQVMGQAVLTGLGAVAGCPWMPPPATNVKCTTVSISSGQATKLTVGGVGVLLASLAAKADAPPANPGGPLIVTASQAKLTAV